jgi:hypothetical protein
MELTKTEIFSTTVVFFFLGAWVFATTAAAQSSAMLLKAKTEAETKGYIFETSHDVIVAKEASLEATPCPKEPKTT